MQNNNATTVKGNYNSNQNQMNRQQGIKGQNNINPNGQYKHQNCTAPLWQQAIDWFRNKYKLLIDSPELDKWNIGKWSVKITSLDKSIVLEEYVGQPYWRMYRCFRTYEEAREKSILRAIKLA